MRQGSKPARVETPEGGSVHESPARGLGPRGRHSVILTTRRLAVTVYFPQGAAQGLKMTPFILKGRRKLPPESDPSNEQVYDDYRQLWIDKKSGTPVVSCVRTQAQPSQFGETTITETREGADQAEVATLQASKFGETTITKTMEGADQFEVTALAASRFGETTVTATVEGADQAEAASFQASQFGETTFTRTREGHDQTEGTPASHSGETADAVGPQTKGLSAISSASFDAPYSHF